MEIKKYKKIFSLVENTLRENSCLPRRLFDSVFGEYKTYENQKYSDNEYYHKMVGIIFYSGFRAETVTKKLDTILSHFPDYETVANYGQNEIDQILSDPKMIRNLKKIEACIKNAKIFKEIISEYSSFDNYVKSFEPNSSFENLMLFKEEIEYKFAFLGGITVYHFMTDIGLPVLKPDRVITRIFKRLKLIENEKQYLKTIIQGRKFSQATNYPIRYIDIIFVKYGHEGEDKTFGLENGICLERNPKCDICGVREYCAYFTNNQK